MSTLKHKALKKLIPAHNSLALPRGSSQESQAEEQRATGGRRRQINVGYINAVTLQVMLMQFFPSNRNGCSLVLLLLHCFLLLQSNNPAHFKTPAPTPPPPALAKDLCLVHGIMVTTAGGEEREGGREREKSIHPF